MLAQAGYHTAAIAPNSDGYGGGFTADAARHGTSSMAADTFMVAVHRLNLQRKDGLCGIEGQMSREGGSASV